MGNLGEALGDSVPGRVSGDGRVCVRTVLSSQHAIIDHAVGTKVRAHGLVQADSEGVGQVGYSGAD